MDSRLNPVLQYDSIDSRSLPDRSWDWGFDEL